MSTSPSPTTTSSLRSKKVLVPKVWKRPHSTIYGKNVEFGSSLYSDKIGEINGRKFNSELPWTMRNSGSSVSTSGASGQYNQGYLSTPTTDYQNRSTFSGGFATGSGGSGRVADSYADLLEMTNPSRFSRRNRERQEKKQQQQQQSGRRSDRIDFYDQYEAGFNKEIDDLNNSSLLANEPLLRRKVFDNYLDYDHELGLFVPTHDRDPDYQYSNKTSREPAPTYARSPSEKLTAINNQSYHPLYPKTMTKQTTLLPKHEFQLLSSPYGQSADGRKLSLGSINPQSYRPSLPQKTSTAHASDGEEFEFQDRSSPFYTDRWAGKTIRHFDSDLYSNANLFKSMIL